jgi:hypothetical protein
MSLLRIKYLLFCLPLVVLAAPAGGPLQPGANSSPDTTRRWLETREPDGTKIDKSSFNPAFDPYAPRPSATSLQPDVPFAGTDPNDVLWTPTVYKGRIVTESKGSSDGDEGLPAKLRPQPVRGGSGAAILGPENLPIELQNADALAPPSSDNGRVSNFKWPFSLSHNKLKKGGWARQQNGVFQKLFDFDLLTIIYFQSTPCLLQKKLLVSFRLFLVSLVLMNDQRC